MGRFWSHLVLLPGSIYSSTRCNALVGESKVLWNRNLLYLFTMWNTLFDGLLMASPHSLLTESLYMVVTAPCQWPAPFTVMGSGVYVWLGPASGKDLFPYWEWCRRRRPFCQGILWFARQLTLELGGHFWLEGAMLLTHWRWQRSKTERARASVISLSHRTNPGPILVV